MAERMSRRVEKAGPFRELMARAAETYKRALIGHQRGLTWDYVVLTAANEHQAAGYRHEVGLRSSAAGAMGAFFPAAQQTLVVPDPEGFRAGSGGATLNVLRAIAGREREIGRKGRPFEGLRILLIHSGGASQRLPLYSPLGKIFMPLPMVRPDGQLMTLFDHLYLMMAALPARLGPGMLVAAGDVFLLFDGSRIPVPDKGVTALAMRVNAEMGAAHGVFKTQTTHGAAHAFPTVAATMQKGTVEQMRSAGFTDKQDQVLIDSGLLFFDGAATGALHSLAKKYTPEWHLKTRMQIDLYSDIAPAALVKQQPVISGDAVVRKLHADLRHALADSPLRVYELPSAAFGHMGTTAQFRDALTGVDASPSSGLFGQNVRVVVETVIPPHRTARLYQSVVAGKVRIGEQAVVENCLLQGDVAVGTGSVLSNLSLGGDKQLSIPAGSLVYSVPVHTGKAVEVVTIVAGVQDDPKTDRTLCNIDFRHWLTLAQLSADDLWPSEERRTLWTAKLYPLGMGVEGALWMTRPETLTADARAAWRAARRFSMGDVLESADAAAMAMHRDALSGTLQAMQWREMVREKTPASVQNTLNHFGVTGYQQLMDTLHGAAAVEPEPLTRGRLWWSLAEVAQRQIFPREVRVALPVPSLQKRAFEAIREAMTPPEVGAQQGRLKRLEPITASAPVRLDLTGGWTDTPPYCLENGGAVVNVAINLNDVEPIQTTFVPLDEPVVRLVSRDLGKTLVVSEPSKLRRAIEAGDPFGLPLTAMRLTGLLPGDGETSMRKYLGRLSKKGMGFELATASNLPKGSGMGTSSILGATTLAVLRAAAGLDVGHAALFEQTLLLEQHLGTGGGWQDQVGGIVGGAKIATTLPGIPQKLQVKKIPLTPAQVKGLEERIVVYFTGQQRLARNILREVMGRYLSREPGTMVLFNELVSSAATCEKALRKSDWLGVAAEINHYWRLKKDLFPGSTTPAVDALFLEMRPYYLGGCLAGAGGGGFAYFLCRDGDQAHRLRTELARVSMLPGSLGLGFAGTINTVGLRVHGG